MAAAGAPRDPYYYNFIKEVIDRRDNTWLQLDVCPTWRETGHCPKLELCCHAHPPKHIEILDSNRVIACFDEVKKPTRCSRKDCKFYHPPDHLKNVVITNGKQNLRLRNELRQKLDLSKSPSCHPPAPLPLSTPAYPPYMAAPPLLPYPRPPYPCQLAAEPALHLYQQPATLYFPATQADQFHHPQIQQQLPAISAAAAPADLSTPLTPPGECSKKRRARETPERSLVAPTKRFSPHTVEPTRRFSPHSVEPSRRLVYQDIPQQTLQYPGGDMFNMMVYPPSLPTLPPTSAYMVYYNHYNTSFGENSVGEVQTIPTLTTNRNGL